MKRILSWPIKHLVLLVMVLAAGCSQKQGSIEATGTKPATSKDSDATSNSVDPAGKDPIDASDLIGEDAALIDATFNIEVSSLFGISVCKGEVDFKFNAGIGKEASAEMFEIPKGVIDCGLVGKINLAEVLGAFSKQEEKPQEDPVVVKNNIINLKQLGKGTYSPPRPLLPNFIATKKDRLAVLNHSENVTVTSSKDGKSSSGTILVRTIGIDQSYKPMRMQRQFNKVLHFEVVNQGFQDIDKFSNLLFDRMEFKISLDPIAVLYIAFKGKVSDAMKAAKDMPSPTGSDPSGGIGGLADGPLIGALTKIIDVNIKMDLVKMKGIKDENAMAEEDATDDLGEEIGGKKEDEE